MMWIDKISEGIKSAFSHVRPPLLAIPPILLICEANSRPGLSAIALTSAIIRRLPEAGILTGVNPDGSPNIICKFVRILVEEFIKEFQNNASVNASLGPSKLDIKGAAVGPAGPMPVSATNILPLILNGILR